MKLIPRSIAGRLVFALGAFALCMGIYGLLYPAAQLRMMGFESVGARATGDYTAILMTITGLATVNTALLYLMGSVKEWPGFFTFAVVSRLLMGIGLAVLAVRGLAPGTFIGAAAWEWLGAILIATARIWDERKARGRTAPQ